MRPVALDSGDAGGGVEAAELRKEPARLRARVAHDHVVGCPPDLQRHARARQREDVAERTALRVRSGRTLWVTAELVPREPLQHRSFVALPALAADGVA